MLTTAELRDDSKLTEWLIQRFADAGLPASRYVMVRGFAAAEHALANSSEPNSLFVLVIAQGVRSDWSNLTTGDIAQGEERYINSRVERTSWDSFCRSAANEFTEAEQIGSSIG